MRMGGSGPDDSKLVKRVSDTFSHEPNRFVLEDLHFIAVRVFSCVYHGVFLHRVFDHGYGQYLNVPDDVVAIPSAVDSTRRMAAIVPRAHLTIADAAF